MLCAIGVLFLTTVHADSAAPLVLESSGSWHGDDGPWSTFLIRIGIKQPQGVFLLPATYEKYISVIPPEGCPEVLPFTNCSGKRGSLFQQRDSETWKNDVDLGIPKAANDQKPFSNFNGTDVVLIGPQPPIWLSSQPIQLQTAMSPFVGTFGLSGDNDTVPGSATIPTALDNAVASANISVKSWSYTAGCYNRGKPGSLILGGYDEARYNNSTLSSWLAMDPKQSQRLKLRLLGFASTISNSSSAWSLPKWDSELHPVILDTATPFLWLPMGACIFLEQTLGLRWDDISQLYLLSDGLFKTLTSGNVTLQFQLGDLNGINVGRYNLHGAFLSLNVSSPLVNSSSSLRYFPIKRLMSSDSVQPWILGRAFFQGIYVTADYYQNKFRIAEVPSDRVENLSPRIKTLERPINISSPHKEPSPNKDVNTTAPQRWIVILVSVIAALAFIVLSTITFCLWAFRTRHRPFQEPGEVVLDGNSKTPQNDRSETGKDLDYLGSTELFEFGDTSRKGELSGSQLKDAELIGDLAPVYEMDGSPPPQSPPFNSQRHSPGSPEPALARPWLDDPRYRFVGFAK